MQVSEHHESSIAEEEHINITYARRKEEPANPQKLRYASVNQIRSFQRCSELYNRKLIESRPLLFGEQATSSALAIHFVSSAREQYFTLGGKKEEARDILKVEQDKLTLKLAVSNIKRQNSFSLSIKNLKKRAVIELKTLEIDNQEIAVKFKYTMSLNDTNLVLRVLVHLDGEYKVWKEVEVPLTENQFTVHINEYNNEQTDIKINQFLFHLLLKMPYHEKINYCLTHNGNAQVERVEFVSQPEKQQISTRQANCTYECQLI